MKEWIKVFIAWLAMKEWIRVFIAFVAVISGMVLLIAYFSSRYDHDVYEGMCAFLGIALLGGGMTYFWARSGFHKG